MFVQKQVILIPHWVPEILRRNQMELGDCLSFEKIKPIMSLNDLIGFAVLQDYLGTCVGAKENLYGMGSLISVWIKSIPENNRDVLNYLTSQVVTLTADQSYRKEVEDRVFAKEARCNHHEKPFITYDLSPEVCGVVIYPGFFGDEGAVSHQLGLVEAILKVLYVYSTHSEAAKTPLFQRYLEQLSGKQIIV